MASCGCSWTDPCQLNSTALILRQRQRRDKAQLLEHWSRETATFGTPLRAARRSAPYSTRSDGAAWYGRLSGHTAGTVVRREGGGGASAGAVAFSHSVITSCKGHDRGGRSTGRWTRKSAGSWGARCQPCRSGRPVQGRRCGESCLALPRQPASPTCAIIPGAGMSSKAVAMIMARQAFSGAVRACGGRRSEFAFEEHRCASSSCTACGFGRQPDAQDTVQINGLRCRSRLGSRCGCEVRR